MRHWTFWEWIAYAIMFVAAILIAVDQGIKLSPDLLQQFPRLVNNSVWGFAPLALVVLSTLILLIREFSGIGRKTQLSTTPTNLRLQFHPNSIIPTSLSLQNIFNWYTLCNIVQIQEGPSAQYPKGRTHDTRTWNIFLVFDQPVAIKQVTVNGNGAILPLTEVKDRGPRHAIIVISGDVGGAIIDFNVVV